MAVTQYIGSRYVPLFADPVEWSSENTYEPLTIVIHQGNSYTSKQAVPKGIDITNEDFWALTGNYNAQVESYRREVAAIADKVADEVEARQAADDSLSQSILDEKEARENADTSLSQSILELQSPYKRLSRINNAHIRFRKLIDEIEVNGNKIAPDMQGSIPISRTGYSYDATGIYFVAVTGNDNQRSITLFNKNGGEISTRSMPNGHFGTLAFDGSSKVYAYNYTSGTPTYGTLFIYDFEELFIGGASGFSIPNPTTRQIDTSIGNSGIFWHKDKLAFVHRTGGNNDPREIYDYDLKTGELTNVCTIDPQKFPSRGRYFAHITYDEQNDKYIFAGSGPLGFNVYASDGTFEKCVDIDQILSYATVGEIESLNVYDGNIWFGASLRHEIANQLFIGFYQYDLNHGMVDAFLPGNIALTYVHVDPTLAPYGTNDTFVTDTLETAGNYPVFTFVEDAANYIRRLNETGRQHTSNRIYIDVDYTQPICLKGLCDCEIREKDTTTGKIHRLIGYACKGVTISQNLVPASVDDFDGLDGTTKNWALFYNSIIYMEYVPDRTSEDAFYTVILASESTLNTRSCQHVQARGRSVVYASAFHKSAAEGYSQVISNSVGLSSSGGSTVNTSTFNNAYWYKPSDPTPNA